MHQCVAFADDVALISRTKQELIDTTTRLQIEAQKVGLTINSAKTKYMVMNRVRNIGINYLTVGEQTYEEVQDFKYLGALITAEGKQGREIEARIAAGNRCSGGLINVLKSKVLSRSAKLKIYKTVIKPVVAYACETLTLTKSEERKLNTWERKILRKIYGGKQVNGIWERRNNQELRDLYQDADLVASIKTQRLRWLGHVLRMDKERVPIRLLDGQIQGNRKRGRPKKRWMDAIHEDLASLGITNWRNTARNRNDWRRVVHQALGLQGP